MDKRWAPKLNRHPFGRLQNAKYAKMITHWLFLMDLFNHTGWLLGTLSDESPWKNGYFA